MKFGGTSVAGAARMRGVADLVAGAAAAERVGVVASAVSGVTDLLIQGLAHAAAGRREEAEAAATRFRDVHAGIAEELAGELGEESSARLARRLSGLAAGWRRSCAASRCWATAHRGWRHERSSSAARELRPLARAFLVARSREPGARSPGVVPASATRSARNPQPAAMKQRLAHAASTGAGYSSARLLRR
jgi:aspartokinase/homoserine dehydrogenase 1